jgi:hypothetical protein
MHNRGSDKGFRAQQPAAGNSASKPNISAENVEVWNHFRIRSLDHPVRGLRWGNETCHYNWHKQSDC